MRTAITLSLIVWAAIIYSAINYPGFLIFAGFAFVTGWVMTRRPHMMDDWHEVDRQRDAAATLHRIYGEDNQGETE